MQEATLGCESSQDTACTVMTCSECWQAQWNETGGAMKRVTQVAQLCVSETGLSPLDMLTFRKALLACHVLTVSASLQSQAAVAIMRPDSNVKLT